MDTNVDRIFAVISNIVVIYSLGQVVISLPVIFFGFDFPILIGLPFLPPKISELINLVNTIGFIFVALYVTQKSIDKSTRKEKFNSWEKFRIIGTIVVVAVVVFLGILIA